MGVQVKLRDPLRTRVIPERFCGGDSIQKGAISSVRTFTFTFNTVQICAEMNLTLVLIQNATNDTNDTNKRQNM